MMEPHDGHRARIRQRYRIEGLDGFADHEVLQLLLFYVNRRGNTNITAHMLLQTFGSLKGVFEASVDQMMQVDGVGTEAATLLSMISPLFSRYRQSAADITSLKNAADAERYCVSLLGGLRDERLYCICLDGKGRIVCRRMISQGTQGEVMANPRYIAETVLQSNATSVILCHNHPGGEATPSEVDRNTTHKLQVMLSTLGVALLDHIIVAEEQCFSMARASML